MPLIDTHTHLDRFVRAGEWPGILARARAAGVEAMIAIGTEPGDWALYRELAAAYPGVVHYAVGLHPCSVDANWRAAVDELAAWNVDSPAHPASGAPSGVAEGVSFSPDHETLTRSATAAGETRPAPVAVGETGLDRFHLPKDDAVAAARLFAWQQESFREHIALAAKWNLPLVVHSRGASAECIAMIDEARFDWSRVVFHCFVEGPEVIGEIVRRGGRGSFTGIATYKTAENVRQAALAQGLDRLMVETDAPYLPPEPHRGKRNEPAFVAHTAAALAKVFGVTPEALAETTTRNAREFFRI